MAEQGAIRADQIEGLTDLIRKQVREAFQEEVQFSRNADVDRRLKRSFSVLLWELMLIYLFSIATLVKVFTMK